MQDTIEFGLSTRAQCYTRVEGQWPAQIQELVGVLWWAVELGRVDILLETAMMSTHLALPRKGHLEQLYHIFSYLKTSSKRKLFFNPQHPDVDERSFSIYDWHDFYHDAGKAIPGDMPAPHGQFVSTHCFVDLIAGRTFAIC